jgi:hypothetical protein
MKYWEISLTSSVLQAGRGASAAPLPEMAGDGSLTPHRGHGRYYFVHSDELLSTFLELEATFL